MRPDFGARPMQASTERKDKLKMRTKANPPLRLFKNAEDHFNVTLFKVTRDLQLQNEKVIIYIYKY